MKLPKTRVYVALEWQGSPYKAAEFVTGMRDNQACAAARVFCGEGARHELAHTKTAQLS
jgi:hypothetical protein